MSRPTPSDRQTRDDTPHPWSVLFDLWLLKQALYPLIEAVIGPSGLSPDEFGLHMHIRDHQPVSPRGIAHSTGMRSNTVSAALKRMRRRGHLVDTRSEADRRSILTRLSDEGLEATSRADETCLSLLERLDDLVDTSFVRSTFDELKAAIAVMANLSDPGTASTSPGRRWNVLQDLWLLKQGTYPLIESAISGTGLSAEEFGLYLLIEDYQPLTPGEVARNSGMRINTASVSLKRLESREHLERHPNDDDGRSVYVSLSEEGLRTTYEAALANQVLLEQLANLLDVERAQVAVDQLNQAVRQIANLPPRVPVGRAQDLHERAARS